MVNSIHMDPYKLIENNGGPTFACIADVHWRGTAPICRTDDFVLAQKRKMSFVKGLCNHYGLKLFVAGDFFDKSIPSIKTIINAIDCLPDQVEIIPGQHDLPNHDINSIDRSGLAILESFDGVTIAK